MIYILIILLISILSSSQLSIKDTQEDKLRAFGLIRPQLDSTTSLDLNEELPILKGQIGQLYTYMNQLYSKLGENDRLNVVESIMSLFKAKEKLILLKHNPVVFTQSIKLDLPTRRLKNLKSRVDVLFTTKMELLSQINLLEDIIVNDNLQSTIDFFKQHAGGVTAELIHYADRFGVTLSGSVLNRVHIPQVNAIDFNTISAVEYLQRCNIICGKILYAFGKRLHLSTIDALPGQF